MSDLEKIIMKILLITNYWHPYNHAGTMRWLQLANHGLQFDILTQEKPNEGFVDHTLPCTYSRRRIYRHGRAYPAVCFGALSLFYVLVYKLYRNYDCIIITCPPQTFLGTAYFLQRIHKRVIVDMRDSIDGWDHKLKLLYLPILKWLYKRIKNKVVSFQFLDPTATVIRSGYDEVSRFNESLGWGWMSINTRRAYEQYINSLAIGFINYYCHKPKGYGSSSFCTLRYLGFKNLPRHFHNEVHDCDLNSWDEAVAMYQRYLA